MHKAQSQPTTIPVNKTLARQNLALAGISTLGITQLLNGQLVSSAKDRAIVTKIILAASQSLGASFWPRVGHEVIIG